MPAPAGKRCPPYLIGPQVRQGGSWAILRPFSGLFFSRLPLLWSFPVLPFSAGLADPIPPVFTLKGSSSDSDPARDSSKKTRCDQKRPMQTNPAPASQDRAP